jgi:hypothetical protein
MMYYKYHLCINIIHIKSCGQEQLLIMWPVNFITRRCYRAKKHSGITVKKHPIIHFVLRLYKGVNKVEPLWLWVVLESGKEYKSLRQMSALFLLAASRSYLPSCLTFADTSVHRYKYVGQPHKSVRYVPVLLAWPNTQMVQVRTWQTYGVDLRTMVAMSHLPRWRPMVKNRNMGTEGVELNLSMKDTLSR